MAQANSMLEYLNRCTCVQQRSSEYIVYILFGIAPIEEYLYN